MFLRILQWSFISAQLQLPFIFLTSTNHDSGTANKNDMDCKIWHGGKSPKLGQIGELKEWLDGSVCLRVEDGGGGGGGGCSAYPQWLSRRRVGAGGEGCDPPSPPPPPPPSDCPQSGVVWGPEDPKPRRPRGPVAGETNHFPRTHKSTPPRPVPVPSVATPSTKQHPENGLSSARQRRALLAKEA